jgi:hypothetical protein
LCARLCIKAILLFCMCYAVSTYLGSCLVVQRWLLKGPPLPFPSLLRARGTKSPLFPPPFPLKPTPKLLLCDRAVI